ncbi:hypothetical protein NEMIN01_0137 [Nematocida minor]|uniref:uncharacterized protein n=1 Tax=Nematocida minor TaxID=1912983 RepID=UPI002220CC44|nr:uncharacterized protein NEMIN01_0033 [Nematocida minor]XP_051332039.1 uncharacterized protein NEMIN01_0137 [Nematocida minor]KAI5188769.1 hypothetical protein NEMIN01_0033 [Nematocida minor]KAI5188873.1 hypothetical protein NEMIN01_0137 [Nematocida minor]
METYGNEKSAFYAFKDRTIEGKDVDFSLFEGKMCLIVNTACNCKLAKNGYSVIKEIKKKHSDLEVLLFPSALNKIVDQTLKTPDAIISRMKEEGVYDIATVFEKRTIDSKAGLFQWLTTQSYKGSFMVDLMKSIKWNFTAFIVSKEGKCVGRISPIDLKLETLEEVISQNM